MTSSTIMSGTGWMDIDIGTPMPARLPDWKDHS